MALDVQGVWDPVYYEGNDQFLDSDGEPSGAVGSEAMVTISINNRPQKLTAVRVVLAYALPEITEVAPQGALGWLFDRITDVEDQMTIETDLSQSNIVVGKAHLRGFQGGVKGQGAIVYHPFPTTFLWRGGNNITFTFRRVVAFPLVPFTDGNTFEITPTVYVVTEGCQLINDIVPPKGPPSTGWAGDRTG